MAVPKFRTSKARAKRRQSVNMKLEKATLVNCSNCGNTVRLHRICPKCGFYRGRQMISPGTQA